MRGPKELRTALASKGFTWITGSPADNEKLSVGKNAQFFGFVALRYQSGRAASRGTLGRAVYAMANAEQRALMAQAVRAEKSALQEWWRVREEILTVLENHLYTGEALEREQLEEIGIQFSRLNAEVAIHEARAYASLEDSLSRDQKERLQAWRVDPETAGHFGRDVRVKADKLARADLKQLEDLYAKAFSWITGKPEDNEVIPIGQPAQFFGFVSIRHKSGHAANRGQIAQDFLALLSPEQQKLIDQAVGEQIPVVRKFLEARHLFLVELGNLRTNPEAFDDLEAERLAEEMGKWEMGAARIEAETYREIRVSMSEEQLAAAMKIRGDYVINSAEIETLNLEERGAALSVLCSGCHGQPGQHREGMQGPSLDGIWRRPIASGEDFEFSSALTEIGSQRGGPWTSELMDRFLAGPKAMVPGTKMEFQGLLNPEDRKALIEHLKRTR